MLFYLIVYNELFTFYRDALGPLGEIDHAPKRAQEASSPGKTLIKNRENV